MTAFNNEILVHVLPFNHAPTVKWNVKHFSVLNYSSKVLKFPVVTDQDPNDKLSFISSYYGISGVQDSISFVELITIENGYFEALVNPQNIRDVFDNYKICVSFFDNDSVG